MADCEAGGAVKAQQRLHGNGTGAVRCGSRRVASRCGPVPSRVGRRCSESRSPVFSFGLTLYRFLSVSPLFRSSLSKVY